MTGKCTLGLFICQASFEATSPVFFVKLRFLLSLQPQKVPVCDKFNPFPLIFDHGPKNSHYWHYFRSVGISANSACKGFLGYSRLFFACKKGFLFRSATFQTSFSTRGLVGSNGFSSLSELIDSESWVIAFKKCLFAVISVGFSIKPISFVVST